MLGDGGGAVAVDDPGDGRGGAGRILRRGEHGAVGTLGGGDTVGREVERDRRPGRQRPRGGDGRQRGRRGRRGGRGGRRRGGRRRPVGRGSGLRRRRARAAGRQRQRQRPHRRRHCHLRASARCPAHRGQYGVGRRRVPCAHGHHPRHLLRGRRPHHGRVPGAAPRHRSPARRARVPRGSGPRRSRALPGHPPGRGARLRRLRAGLPRRRSPGRGPGPDDGPHRRAAGRPAARPGDRHRRARHPARRGAHRPRPAGRHRVLLRRHAVPRAGPRRGRPQGRRRLPLRALHHTARGRTQHRREGPGPHRGRRPHRRQRRAARLRGGDAGGRRRLAAVRLRRRGPLVHEPARRGSTSPGSPTTNPRTAAPGRRCSTCSPRSSEQVGRRRRRF